MTGFMSQLQLDWGSVLRQLFNLAKASSGGLPPFIDCAGVSFEAEMAATQMLPLVVPTLPLLMLGAWAALQRARKRPTAQIWGVDKKHFYINACVAISYLLWPAFVVQNLRILNCSVEVGEKRFVASALQVQCDEGAHPKLKAVAIVELALLVPALPALLLYRLRKLDVSEGSWNRKHLFFLFGGFRPGFEYWEAVVLGRKFLVLAIGVFLADNTFGLQVTACMWVVAAATVLQLLCKPYQHRTEERLETLSLGGTTVAMMIGQVILQADGADGLAPAVLAACQGCVVAILLFTTCCFVVFFVREVMVARRAKKAKKAKEVIEERSATGPVNPILSHAAPAQPPMKLSAAAKAHLMQIYGNAVPVACIMSAAQSVGMLEAGSDSDSGAAAGGGGNPAKRVARRKQGGTTVPQKGGSGMHFPPPSSRFAMVNPLQLSAAAHAHLKRSFGHTVPVEQVLQAATTAADLMQLASADGSAAAAPVEPVLRSASSIEARSRMGSTDSWRDLGVVMASETTGSFSIGGRESGRSLAKGAAVRSRQKEPKNLKKTFTAVVLADDSGSAAWL